MISPHPNQKQLLFSDVRSSLASGKTLPDLVADWIVLLRQIDAIDPAIWITRFSDEQLLAAAEKLEEKRKSGTHSLPLFGIPFAVKDNIDVAGLPTSAACPAFSYLPASDAFAVRLLLDAGAFCIGKTNLDQFATGLTGTRSPYGIPQNPLAPDFIPGGSSSGSAVATARGLVAFALGTDTAGSGRVPAAFNNLVGWKPTKGSVSTTGVVPACRSLDCVSVFANHFSDTQEIAEILTVFDDSDPFARISPISPRPSLSKSITRIAIPLPDQLEFFGDSESAALWLRSITSLKAQGASITEKDFSPFFAAAKLLYDGPWLAERYCATRSLLEKNPDAFLPVTRQIISAGASIPASQAFTAQYKLAELRRQTDTLWKTCDAICLPTTGSIFRIDEIAQAPVSRNTDLGLYTNFVNLLDLCALASPAGFRKNGTPFGITLMAPAWNDLALFAFWNPSFQTKAPTLPPPPLPFLLAVCGAHMRGLPLNPQLLTLGASFVSDASTAPAYRMFAIDEKRPGLVRALSDGKSLPLEIWQIPSEKVGSFLAAIPAPLGLGKISLSDDSEVCGFLCEASATTDKTDITDFGGWRAWLKKQESHLIV